MKAVLLNFFFYLFIVLNVNTLSSQQLLSKNFEPSKVIQTNNGYIIVGSKLNGKVFKGAIEAKLFHPALLVFNKECKVIKVKEFPELASRAALFTCITISKDSLFYLAGWGLDSLNLNKYSFIIQLNSKFDIENKTAMLSKEKINDIIIDQDDNIVVCGETEDLLGYKWVGFVKKLNTNFKLLNKKMYESHERFNFSEIISLVATEKGYFLATNYGINQQGNYSTLLIDKNLDSLKLCTFYSKENGRVNFVRRFKNNLLISGGNILNYKTKKGGFCSIYNTNGDSINAKCLGRLPSDGVYDAIDFGDGSYLLAVSEKVDKKSIQDIALILTDFKNTEKRFVFSNQNYLKPINIFKKDENSAIVFFMEFYPNSVYYTIINVN